ncbi:phosphodiester glycosidase family protein [Synechococcus sp. Tobar12-5m-g]|uniref:phosphodiester glycosidase family protein n=1 Tax=unclassified Synechococcus TaxID=2626047 RepID=UPI0020CF237A|nr:MULTISPECIES: phosphodiester glycosidase family protein [unclassified Synechococcus]MCP9773609.1 phosphodiester glycosidase family protein [Synechococcus sp. Tobar12-5m-g]MCP9874581.1 phosphodiester glycosidase family protein [Synechococcus sp. Cruz CV-v-12]
MARPILKSSGCLSLGLALLPLLSLALPPGAHGQGSWRGPASLTGPASAQTQSRQAAALRSGQRVMINGITQQARWQWRDADGFAPLQLWLPLDLLQGQLGFSSRSQPDGSLELEWFDQTLKVPSGGQRSLDDEVAVDVAPLLQAAGVRLETSGEGLVIVLPRPALVRVRVSSPGGTAALGGRRVVLDLDGIAAVRQDSGRLLVGLRSTTAQRAELQALGLTVGQSEQGLSLSLGNAVPKLLVLGGPARVVLDLAGVGLGGPAAAAGANGIGAAGAGPFTAPPARLDPRLQALLSRSVTIERQVRVVGARSMLINSVRLDPRRNPLELRLLTRSEGMEGLSSLPALAQGDQALVAINGGFFNRVRRLPLGALKDQGRWLSGPILNRGAVGWQPGELPRFGRLRLEDWVIDAAGQRWPLTTVNSGYIERGLARYTADWGRGYRALSGAETGLILSGGLVQRQLTRDELANGVGLGPDDTLLVARAGATAPWAVGNRLAIASRPDEPLGQLPFVLGGGPLLLLQGQVVLNGTGEGFSQAFLQQGAPRTVIGSDGRELWLLTLEGVEHNGPTLSETAVLLRQLGLRDALNLDGGSSTGLVVGGAMTVKGRGVTASIHNGLGLVPRGDQPGLVEGPTKHSTPAPDLLTTR